MEYSDNENMIHKSWVVRHKKLVIGLGIIVLAFISLIVLFVTLASFNSARERSFAPTSSLPFSFYDGIALEAVRGVSFEEGGGQGGVVGQETERKVIKNGSLSLVVGNTEEVIENIKDVAEQYDGFVASARVYESGNDKKIGNITIRIPADDFGAALRDVKGFAIKVTNENIVARDVTEEFVDLDAQLRNYKASEEQYLTILKRADTVEDILKVQRELDRIRGEVERLQGRMNLLSRQIDMATISVSLVSEAEVEIFGIVWSPIQELKQGVRDMLSGLVNFANIVIALVFRLPVILLWVVLVLLVAYGAWHGFRFVRKRFTNKSYLS